MNTDIATTLIRRPAAELTDHDVATLIRQLAPAERAIEQRALPDWLRLTWQSWQAGIAIVYTLTGHGPDIVAYRTTDAPAHADDPQALRGLNPETPWVEPHVLASLKRMQAALARQVAAAQRERAMLAAVAAEKRRAALAAYEALATAPAEPVQADYDAAQAKRTEA